MSKETQEWLNRNVLIGYTERRGNAWHYRASDQGDEPNHYPGAIPLPDVARRLFSWEPAAGVMSTTVQIDGEDVVITDASRKVIVRPDTRTILGAFKDAYQPHGYYPWLVQGPAQFLGSDLAIGSAGLLKLGAVAWVQIEMEDTFETPSGVEFRPFLTAATSLDGTLKTTYLTGSQVVVCDNTLQASLSDRTHAIKIKHTAKSLGKIGSITEALGLVAAEAEDFTAQVESLAGETVTDATWRAFLDAYVPEKEEKGRAATIAEHKRSALTRLWTSDARVSPWKGTAFGVLQAVNTYQAHEATVRNMERAERNTLSFLLGKTAEQDTGTLALLRSVS